MGMDSSIEWTDHTFNPWWGCSKVSPGCGNCYADNLSKRYNYNIWGKDAPRRFLSEANWKLPLKWNALAIAETTRKRIFCASMADVFENRTDLIKPRERLFELIKQTPMLDWQLLTKRPQNIEKLIPEFNLPNVWLGTSAEDQERWNERVSVLMSLPATIRFVSAEPLLGPIDMNGIFPEWLIVGGESGHGARPMEKSWVESLQKQSEGKTAFFFKQWGGVRKKQAGRELNGKIYGDFPA